MTDAPSPKRAAWFEGLWERRCVVTGGAGGIGRAAAARLADFGARVAIVDVDEEALDDARVEDPRVETVRADVTDDADVARAFRDVDDLLGGVDVLVANAGISMRAPFLETTADDWRRVVAVNLDGVANCTREACARMMRARDGVVLMTASTNGVVGHPLYASYNASKAGVILLARTLALELAPFVRVNALCPGYVWTPMQSREYTPDMVEKVNARIPLARHATTDEVADVMAFLLSDHARYITGAAIALDGGELAGGTASWTAAPPG